MTSTDAPGPQPDPSSSPLLVALDVDGTIVHHDGHLSPRVAEAVRALDDLPHVTVVIATGRSVISTLPVMDALGITTPGRPAVCSNGAVTVAVAPERTERFDIVEQVTFDPAPAIALVRTHLPSALVAVEEIGVGFKVSTPFPEGELWGEEIEVPVEELAARPATRVTFREPTLTTEDFTELVERIGLHGVSYAVGYSAWLDLAPEGVSKASALEQVRRRLGVEPHRTIAVGDQRNDIEMLHWAAVGYAMGQAPVEVLRVADRTTGAVEEDGLADALAEVLDEFA
ncbi:HAD-superfamily hydrolase, subfamily IIB [Serinicoccus hydrothermalis]|uniref:HAD-superfamily hydrolase, subfamily IIB n=1 Tax=Serinicoccus hydrothermalis TaxID=1758689 RepID=A0A1B1NCA2_9MICO|nr:HAD family hydrolase [Serinicoccus hydrothermalis]ANS79058.1 HAD-superfamily hydrolase, subfamily IIB [Serinicoccus hydrothermalis]